MGGECALLLADGIHGVLCLDCSLEEGASITSVTRGTQRQPHQRGAIRPEPPQRRRCSLPSRTMHQTIRAHLSPGVRPAWPWAVRGSRALTMRKPCKQQQAAASWAESWVTWWGPLELAQSGLQESKQAVGLTGAASFDRQKSFPVLRVRLPG